MQALINNFVLCLLLLLRLRLCHKINYVDTLNNYVVCRRSTLIHTHTETLCTCVRVCAFVCSAIKGRMPFGAIATTKVHFCLIFPL